LIISQIKQLPAHAREPTYLGIPTSKIASTEAKTLLVRKTMKNRVAGAVLVFGLIASAANPAAAAAVQCVNCTEAQMYNAARALGASTSAHLVWDPATGNIKRYRNSCGSSPNSAEPGPAKGATAIATACNLQTEELQVAANLATVAAAMSEVWRQTSGTFKADFTSNISGISYPSYYPGKPTAHDFLTDISLRGDILDLANTPEIFSTPGTGTSGSLRNALATLTADVNAYLSFKQGVYLTIKVQFHDGSKVSIKLTLGEDPQYVPNSARDSSGHALPDPDFGTPAYPGRWYFGPGDSHNMAEFIEYMRALGVTITSGTVPNGQVNCVWQPSSNTTTCFIPRRVKRVVLKRGESAFLASIPWRFRRR